MKKIYKYLYLVIILLVAALNFNLFLKPLKLVTGGTQGLAIILNQIFNIKHSTIILFINILMLILSYLLLSKKATIGTIIATLIYPFFVRITSNLNFNFSIIILNVLISGILSGVTNGLIYKLGFTTGGINILAPIINKYFKYKVGSINFFINGIIIIIGCFIFSFKNILYSLLVIFINSALINLLNNKKL